jgi:cephalosporin hydroxylase
MKLIVDLTERTVVQEEPGERRTLPLDSPEAFRLLSRCWLEVGWTQKYSYSFTWLGRPMVQLPEDMIRIQEVIYQVRPDVIVETGVAHGGSLIFYASLCKAMDHGRVIGVDIEIRQHNRRALEDHPLASYITLLEGSSTDPAVVGQVKVRIEPGETALIVLDSCHTRQHVLVELEAYAPFVSKGSYLIATDGIMAELAGAPRTQPDWCWNNPQQAAVEFVRRHAEFAIVKPPLLFNESTLDQRVTYWPSAFIKRVCG